MAPEAEYTFTLPSVADDTVLSCKVYHPKELRLGSTVKGAVLAHPYAPLGGSQADSVVVAVVTALLKQGHVVGTFDFRGAGDSEGKTTWTGKAEQDDFATVIGFFIHYLQGLDPANDAGRLETIISATWSPESGSATSNALDSDVPGSLMKLLLGGYSYGSLILARLPSVEAIIERFESALKGTAAAEVLLRARTLARKSVENLNVIAGPGTISPVRGRQLGSRDVAHISTPGRRIGVSPITVGGEETDSESRRRSQDAKHGTDIMRRSLEAPHKIKARLRHSNQSQHGQTEGDDRSSDIQALHHGNDPRRMNVEVQYLIISPFLLPFTNALSPPRPPSIFPRARKHGETDSDGKPSFLGKRTLAIFGSADGFTSAKRLRSWAERATQDANGSFEWLEVAGAGHFWQEPGVMDSLLQHIAAWA